MRPIESTSPALAPATPRAARPTPPSGVSFADVFRRVGQSIDRGDALVGTALSPRAGSSTVELLALQAGIYRYGEAIDLVSKAVDHASNAVKTVIQGQ